jgi:hypothetical protein
MALQIDPNDIAKARESGYSDAEITSFLSEKHPDQFKQAKDAGYNDHEILAHLSGDVAKPSGIIAGLQHGVASHVRDMGETGKDFAGLGNDKANSVANTIDPKDYQGAPIIRPGGHFYNPSDINFRNIPQNLAEAAPGVGQDLLVGASVGKVNKWAGLAAGVGSTLLRTLGPMAKENAKARTGDENAEPNVADKERALITGAVQAPINATSLGRVLPGIVGKTAGVGVKGAGNALAKYLTTVGVEGGAGVARDAVGQVGTTMGTDEGTKFDANQAAASGITSAAGGALLASPRLARDGYTATKFREFGGDNAQAAAALANRQITAADGKNLVGPLGGTKTAAEAVADAHSDVHNELKDSSSKLSKLSTDGDNTIQRIKDGGAVSNTELKNLEAEVSADPEGASTIHLARQALLSKKLKDMGDFNGDSFNGGVSGLMDKNLRPLYQPVGAAASAAAALAGHAGGLGMIGMAAPSVIGGVYGTYAAARALDKITGARSPAQGFTDKFADANVPVRVDPAVPAAPAPVSTSVPQVTPPQNTKLWGNPELPPEKYNPRPNIQIDEGIAKIAKQLSDSKRKAMVAETMPALRALAERQGPNAAPVSLPDSFASTLGKDPVASDVQAEVPVSAASVLKKLAVKPAADIAVNTGSNLRTDAPASPEIGSLLSRLRGQDTATSSPSIAPQMPEAPMITKIMKKLKGSVESTPYTEAEKPYTPIASENLWRKPLDDHQVAAQELSSYDPVIRKKYAKNVVASREAKRDVMESIANDHTPADANVASTLYHQLDHISRRAEAQRAIDHYTKLMSPEAAQATREKFGPAAMEKIWRM